MDARPAVGVFRLQLFKRSETFIPAQAEALRRWRPVYVGRRLHGPPPPGAEVVRPTALGDRLRVALLADPAPFVRALAGRRLDLLHAHFGVDALYALPLARRLGVPLLVTLHGFDVSRRPLSLLASGRPALLRWALGSRRGLSRADAVVAVSQAVAAAALRRGAPAGRLQVLPVGVDLAALRPAGEGEPGLVVHVGRLVEKKGAAVLIAAFAALAPLHPGARLAVVGEGRLRRRLERQVRRAGLGERVRFLGGLPHGDALDWLRRAAVVAVPSRAAADGDAEGLPIVALEAAALGRAVVASDAGGLAEAFRDGESALLAPPDDARALAAAIGRLLADAGLRRRLGTGARRAVERSYDLRACTRALERLYDRLEADRHGD